MALGGVAMGLDPCDLGPQRLDPRRQFVDRQGPQVLPAKLDQRILRFRGKEIVEIHGVQR